MVKFYVVIDFGLVQTFGVVSARFEKERVRQFIIIVVFLQPLELAGVKASELFWAVAKHLRSTRYGVEILQRVLCALMEFETAVVGVS